LAASEARPAVLNFLREQFARVHAKLDRLIGDLDNLKVRMSEADFGHTRAVLAEVNGRLDRMDKRLDRIERRLDLVGVEP
jgi:tetrahydromethanopterin S-methyltransferase subunit G